MAVISYVVLYCRSYPSSHERLTGGTESQTEAPEASATTSPNVSSQSSGPSASEGSSEFIVEFKESSAETQYASHTFKLLNFLTAIILHSDHDLEYSDLNKWCACASKQSCVTKQL